MFFNVFVKKSDFLQRNRKIYGYGSPMYDIGPAGQTETPNSDSNDYKAKAHLSKHKINIK